MSGPVASVLLPRPLTEADLDALRRDIDRVCVRGENGPTALDDFLVCDTREIGGSYVGSGRPLALAIGLEQSDPDMLQQVEAAFGHAVAEEVSVIAFRSRDEDHLVVGELSLLLAERFGGIVDFGGQLMPIVRPPERLQGIAWWDWDWQQCEPICREMLAALPGRLVTVTYEIDAGRRGAVHVGDATFMRAWLAHPQFHMVK